MKSMKQCTLGASVFLLSTSVLAAPVGSVEAVTYESGTLKLQAMLYKPAGPGPFPALLYNHGSARGNLSAQAASTIGPYFVKRGWVFFMPWRRGQGENEHDAPYIMNVVAATEAKSGREAAEKKLVELMTTEQLNDQLAAFAWLKKQNFIAEKRVATMGNSFGGIQSILGAEKGTYCAAISASGAAQSWATAPHLREVLQASVKKAKAPIFFLQAENDYDLNPQRVLADVMKKAKMAYELKVYPRYGQSNEEGHAFAYKGVAVWESDVFRFLDQNCLTKR